MGVLLGAYNLGDALVPLDDPLTIWGAMLGTPAVSVPIDTRDGSSGSGEEKMVFTTKGKMVRYKDGRPHRTQNTTISAILVWPSLAGPTQVPGSVPQS